MHMLIWWKRRIERIDRRRKPKNWRRNVRKNERRREKERDKRNRERKKDRGRRRKERKRRRRKRKRRRRKQRKRESRADLRRAGLRWASSLSKQLWNPLVAAVNQSVKLEVDCEELGSSLLDFGQTPVQRVRAVVVASFVGCAVPENPQTWMLQSFFGWTVETVVTGFIPPVHLATIAAYASMFVWTVCSV